MTRLTDVFRNGKVFIPYVCCGDPDLDTSEQIILALARNGAGIIELGIPFSDPTAEGPVIMAASLRALQAGATTDRIFDMIEHLREQCDVPLVIMTYANVVYGYGMESFLARAEKAGISGLILPDVPYEEKEEFAHPCKAHGIDLISMIAPTSVSRISMIASQASGFLYIVSSLGVTGMRSEIDTDIESLVREVRRHTDLPCAVGFGISTPVQAQKMAAVSDGAICGSAISRLCELHGLQAPEAIGAFGRQMAQAVNSPQ